MPIPKEIKLTRKQLLILVAVTNELIHNKQELLARSLCGILEEIGLTIEDIDFCIKEIKFNMQESIKHGNNTPTLH